MAHMDDRNLGGSPGHHKPLDVAEDISFFNCSRHRTSSEGAAELPLFVDDIVLAIHNKDRNLSLRERGHTHDRPPFFRMKVTGRGIRIRREYCTSVKERVSMNDVLHTNVSIFKPKKRDDVCAFSFFA